MGAGTGLSYASKAEFYRELAAQCHALIDNERDPVANMANCAALVFNSVPRLNWVGFYLLKGGELVLGPFKGNRPVSESHSDAASAGPRRRAAQLFGSRT